MKIGHSRIPRMRVPALLKGRMILFDLGSVQGKWSIVCHFPLFDFGEAIVLNKLQRTVQKEGAELMGLLPFGDSLFDPQLPKTKALRIPLLADPLQRLHRRFGLNEQSSTDRCQSYIIDKEGVIRYHLVHQLSWRGLSFLIEILKHCQDQFTQSTKPFSDLRGFANTSDSLWQLGTRTLPTLIKIS